MKNGSQVAMYLIGTQIAVQFIEINHESSFMGYKLSKNKHETTCKEVTPMLVLRNKTNFPALWNDRSTSAPTRFSDWMDEVFEDAFQWAGRADNTFVPELNVYETDKEFELTVALPGMNKEDFEINYENGLLSISGERKMEHEENGRRYHRIESRFGKFNRTLPLPSDIVNQDKISAKYENGVLYVTVPKTKEKSGKKIKVS